MIDYCSSFGDFLLKRFPVTSNDTLQAWDSADQYLLRHLNDSMSLKSERVLIVNDSFGALTIPVSQHLSFIHKQDDESEFDSIGKCYSVSDSFVSERAYIENCKLNAIDDQVISFIKETEAYPLDIDVVLIKIPKSLALLEEQLHRIKKIIKPSSIVLAGGKSKDIHNSTLNLFQSVIGSTSTSLAWKKSRLIFTNNDLASSFANDAGDISGVRVASVVKTGVKQIGVKQIGVAKTGVKQIGIEQTGINQIVPPSLFRLDRWDLDIRSHASVFSQAKLDQGTSFFLTHLRVGENDKTIIDLGCGNGVIGLVAKRLNPKAKLLFVDESYMAVASAAFNYKNNFKDSESAEFIVSDCLSTLMQRHDGYLVDRVLCNPPFHQHNAMDKQTAHRMMRHAHTVLNDRGEIWVIANRHLRYHLYLKKRFGHCELIAGNNKFVVLRAIKSG